MCASFFFRDRYKTRSNRDGFANITSSHLCSIYIDDVQQIDYLYIYIYIYIYIYMIPDKNLKFYVTYKIDINLN